MAEHFGIGNETEHEMALTGKIIEMSGMGDRANFAYNINDQILVSSESGNAQDHIPSAFYL